MQIFNKKQVLCKQGVSVTPVFLVHSTEQQASRLHRHYCCWSTTKGSVKSSAADGRSDLGLENKRQHIKPLVGAPVK